MKSDYEVIDNFLDEEYFDKLVTTFVANIDGVNDIMPWFMRRTVAEDGLIQGNLFYMTHSVYDENIPMTQHYETILPLLEKLGTRCLLRLKANFYPNTHILYEHPMHIDYDFSHYGAILSLNTCDGYTKLEDGTKIDSIANRILLFDSSKKHCSTTTTNTFARINININFILENGKERNEIIR